jgi:NAD(P)-dependent dehydrogenase (short-subunit alcohol dehydrogenase family)
VSAGARRAFLTGANRGIGLEYARQLAAAGWRVFASCRSPEEADELAALARERSDRVTVVGCDVADDASVRAAAAAVGGAADGLELVLNNAGVGGWRGGIEELDLGEVVRVFDVNALGPMRVAREFLPLLRAGAEPRRLVQMTSLMGSIADNRSGGAYPYRISKCALNMATVNLARELAEDGIVTVALHPGWVRTDMGGSGATLPVDEAVEVLLGTIEGLSMEDSGGLYDRDGERLPW